MICSYVLGIFLETHPKSRTLKREDKLKIGWNTCIILCNTWKIIMISSCHHANKSRQGIWISRKQVKQKPLQVRRKFGSDLSSTRTSLAQDLLLKHPVKAHKTPPKYPPDTFLEPHLQCVLQDPKRSTETLKTIRSFTSFRSAGCGARYALTLGLQMLLCFVWQPSYELLRLQYTFVPRSLKWRWLENYTNRKERDNEMQVPWSWWSYYILL